MSTRKGVWDLQQVRDKYLQELWVNGTQLMVWGSNSYGGLGLNEGSVNRSSPIQVGTDTNWSTIGSITFPLHKTLSDKRTPFELSLSII